MAWIKIDDQFSDHPKVIAAGPLAAWLHICGLTYCGRYLTDGLIPLGQLRKLADVDNAIELAARLVEVGLWEETEGGFLVHDYLDYNPSAAKVKAERAANARRQADWRGHHRTDRGTFSSDTNGSNAVTNPVTKEEVTTAPSPSPSPSPDPCPSKDKAESASAQPPDFLRLQFEMSVPVIQDRQLTRSQWMEVMQSEKDANGRKTLIKWIDSKLNGGGHPAVVAYREEMEHNPRKNQYKAIIDAIGENGKMDVWRGVVRGWKLYGWNPYNIAGMLEAYAAGGIQKRPGGGRKPTGMDAFDQFEKAMGWSDGAPQPEGEVIDVEYTAGES